MELLAMNGGRWVPGGRRCRSLFWRGGACVPPLPPTDQPPASTNEAPPRRRRTNKGPLARRYTLGIPGSNYCNKAAADPTPEGLCGGTR